MNKIRKPNVAGQFYPAKAALLKEMILSFLKESRPIDIDEPPKETLNNSLFRRSDQVLREADVLETGANVSHVSEVEKRGISSKDGRDSRNGVFQCFPKAIIAPHAGYVYSGPIAATVYALLSRYKDTIKKVILVGPSHRMYFKGIAATTADFFETPLGKIPVAKHEMLAPFVNDAAYEREHSLEVQLPFLQIVLEEFELIPLIVGDEGFTHVADVMASLWGGKETLIIVSSDLSHYKDYHAAQRLDADTTRAIIDLAPERLHFEQACGLIPIQGLLQAAMQHNLQARALDVRNSGDISGSKDRVVGYGAYCFFAR